MFLGSPDPPVQIQVTVLEASLRLTWQNGEEGVSPIEGYMVQARRRNSKHQLCFVYLDYLEI